MLNESQCRHVSATLRVNEERLLDLQCRLTGERVEEVAARLCGRR
jgi:hypothetical protein